MLYTRRDVGRLGLVAGLASTFGSKLIAEKPNSKINGVQIGTITYSYRNMPDQSAEATLKYIVDSGISAIELMGGPVNDWARKKGKWDSSPAAAADVAGGRGGAFPSGGGGGRGRGEQTPEQKAAADAERKWRLALSMDIFKELRKLYNDAGVSIYAVKDVRQDNDEDLDYTFTVARTL